MSDAGLTVEGDRWLLSGELDFETVPSLLAHEGAHMQRGSGIYVDFAKVTRVDSAGLALMIEWLRESERKGLVITYDNVPPQLLSIARLCGLEDILFQPR
ncbi:MAG: STAS domain-containing protein [Gammaproteobacteria bacterium]|nr:STAS domain-containing protein [Gammaproteobacteria bacterium]NNJ95039.1 STAS domain-containing protein [Halobacteria archaeon]